MDDLKNSRRIADLAQEIRRLREIAVPSPSDCASPTGKSEKAKEAQMARLKERVHQLERRVRDLQQENELL
jgi:polyhydroxyalkanoate synthesis regulator phasin